MLRSSAFPLPNQLFLSFFYWSLVYRIPLPPHFYFNPILSNAFPSNLSSFSPSFATSYSTSSSSNFSSSSSSSLLLLAARPARLHKFPPLCSPFLFGTSPAMCVCLGGSCPSSRGLAEYQWRRKTSVVTSKSAWNLPAVNSAGRRQHWGWGWGVGV